MNNKQITATVIRPTNGHVLVWYRANPFSCDNAMGYVKKNSLIPENVAAGDTFQMPANPIPFQKVDDAGNVYCTKDGEPLTFLKW
tara:strand:- start:764 stop:1018 length:255 start_codon:yes stop_codon:yes gene_type:complete